MNDQAQRLRELTGDGSSELPRLPALAVTGGKGGVGKTSLAVNIAVLLAKAGVRPLLVDCDLGLANADVLLGLDPETTLFDVIMDQSPIGGAICEHPSGVSLIPTASGREELTQLSDRQRRKLIDELARAVRTYDLLILDTAAGIHREVMDLLISSEVILVTVTPDPTSLTDAYALIKLLEQKQPGNDLRVVVNQVANEDEARRVHARLRQVTSSFLGRDLNYAGFVPRDRSFAESVRKRQPLAMNSATGPAIAALKSIATRLKGTDWKKSERSV